MDQSVSMWSNFLGKLGLKDDYKDHKFHMARGDFTEKKAYNVVKEVFRKTKHNVVIIQGIEIIRTNPDRTAQNRELDLLIIDQDLKLIINIECQQQLIKTDRLKKKLEDHKNFIFDWLGADLDQRWSFATIFFYEKQDKANRRCDHCSKYLACGEEQLKTSIENLLKDNELICNKRATLNEFKSVIKFLMFCSSNLALPIGLNFNNRIEEAMAKQGSLDNIRIWGFPTPEQKALLFESYLLFMAAWGTGKTTLMTWKAIELASRGEKVLFLIFTNAYFVKRETLLFLDLQRKLHAHKNVTIKQISFHHEVLPGTGSPNIIHMRPGNNALLNLTKDSITYLLMSSSKTLNISVT